MKKTIEIPEGYEARIEGNKVILERKDGEDERIRKEMLNSLKEAEDCIVLTPFKKKSWIAYLERQKPIYNLEIPAGDVAPAEEDGPFDEDEFLDNELSAFLQNYDKEYDDDAAVSDVARHFYEIGKKQKEHKSVQDKDEREYVSTLKSLVADFVRNSDGILDLIYYQEIYDWLDGRHIEQQPSTAEDIAVAYQMGLAEGRREQKLEKDKDAIEPTPKQDYSGLTDLERAIHRGFLCAGIENVPVGIIKETAQDCLEHIKSAEWSEEDEKKLTTIISLMRLNRAIDPFYDKMCLESWLKSLHPQPHWKPSEEQMEALNEIINTLAVSKHPHENDYLFNILNGLRKNLKKL